MKLKPLTLCVLFSLMVFSAQAATTWYVNSSTGSDSNNGTTALTPFKTLDKIFGNTAIGSYIAAVTPITLSDGDSVKITGYFRHNYGKNIRKSITLFGVGSAVIDSVGTNRNAKFIEIGYYNNNDLNTVTFQNITFQNITNLNNEAAIAYIRSGSTLIVKNCKFLNNVAANAPVFKFNGGVASLTSTLTIEDSYFYNNYAAANTNTACDGGVIGCSLTASGTTNNLTINRCLFEANKADRSGSVLYINPRTATIEPVNNFLIQNCTFTGNIVKRTTNAGGTNPNVNINGAVYIEGTSVAANTTSNIKFINNTFAYNNNESTQSYAPAAFALFLDNEATLINNIFYSNTNNSTGTPSVSILNTSNWSTYYKFKESRNNITDGFNLASTNSTTSGFASGNANSATNLNLAASLADNGGTTKTLALSSGSIAINAGYTTGAPTVDQRKFGRTDGLPDVGAYEFNGLTTKIINTDTSKQLFYLQNHAIVSNVDGLMEVINFSGKTIRKAQISSGQSLSIPQGIYIVRITSNAGNSVEKVRL
jgi:hypothetical protein